MSSGFPGGVLAALGDVQEFTPPLLPSTPGGCHPPLFPLPLWLATGLSEHVELYGDPNDPDAFMFTSPQGQPLRPNNWRNRFRTKAVERAGLNRPPTPHDMRRTAASLMIANRFSIEEAKQVLGHGSAPMVLHYAEMYEENLENKVSKVGSPS